MKTKRLVLLLSIFALIVMIVILSSTVFSLSKVEVAFLEVPTKYSTEMNAEIIKSGDFKKGQSIFLVKKKTHITKIEQQYPNLKVVGIETCFPNRLVIQVVERQEFLALYNHSVEKYYVVDSDMKVLRIVENLTALGNVARCMITQDLSNYNYGEFIASDRVTEILTKLADAFWRCGYSEKEMNAFVKSVYVDTVNNELNISTYCKFRFNIKKPDTKLAQKLFAGNNAVFGEKGVGEDFVGEILVYENIKEGKIYANAVLNG